MASETSPAPSEPVEEAQEFAPEELATPAGYLYSPETRGFYVVGLHPDIPADAVEITDEEHRALIDAQAAGKRIEPDAEGRPVALDPAPVPLADLKAAASVAVDAEAERQRLRWITPGAGQAMTYARKVEEAKAVQAAGEPVPEDYPMLAASIGIDGADLAAVAATILAMDAAWALIGAAIETRRLQLKRAIGAAASTDDIDAIDINTGWPESSS